MKILGISFSDREYGNCANSLQHCLDELKKSDCDTKFICAKDYDISICGDCNYICFKGECPKSDGMSDIIDLCRNAEKIIFALPTFRGHLPASYFTFSERLEGFRCKGMDLDDIIFRKLNLILIGNLSAGGDMALHEALYEFVSKPFTPEVLLLSSREYQRKSLNGDLIEEDLVRQRLSSFTNNLFRKG